MPNFITQEAMSTIEITKQNTTTQLEHLCETLIHLVTGEYITNYKKLAKDPATREVWTTGFGKEWGNLEQIDHKNRN